jgi:hypothetical protein
MVILDQASWCSFRGPVERSYDWLDRVEHDPSILPYDTMAWEVLESEFKQSFVDYAEHEKAQDEI